MRFLSQTCTRTFSGCRTPFFSSPAHLLWSHQLSLSPLSRSLSTGPLAQLEVDQSGIVLPASAWSNEQTEYLIGVLVELAASSYVGDELPPPIDGPEALLMEMSEMMDFATLHQTLEALQAYGESSNTQVASVGRVLVQLAHLDGLKLVAPPTPSDPQTFSQHLLALSTQLNLLHDTKTLGGYMNSGNFRRSKYELFALQHMQLLVWLQRVHTALVQATTTQQPGQQLTQYMVQLSHAARSMVFQPALLHALQVVQFVTSLPKDEVHGSMRLAMLYPADTATDADRVEWLQLNLLLQFQSIYKDALCSPAIYTLGVYSPGEANLFQGFLRLEEIYTHLIGRFPQCCPLQDQEQAVLTQLCQKLNKFFLDGKRIRRCWSSRAAGRRICSRGRSNITRRSLSYATGCAIYAAVYRFTKDHVAAMVDARGRRRRRSA